MTKSKSLLSPAFLIIIIFFMTSSPVWAWGRRGHQIVGETAALLVSSEPDAAFMRAHSFDIGYYNNVPDFIWKRPATYDIEKINHFIDLEAFDRAFAKHPDIAHPFELSRLQFDKDFPEVKPSAGRSFWRIQELAKKLDGLTTQLRGSKLTHEDRRKLQGQWLVLAGLVGHYVGDLAQPLHVSENYNGEKTHQKGIHGYFEETMVDALYPQIDCDVNREAELEWPIFKAKNADKTTLELIRQLARDSLKDVGAILAIDKRTKRANIKKNAKLYHDLIRKRLVMGALTLAEIYSHELGWKFDNKKFYFFDGEPAYIPAPKEVLDTPPAPAAAHHQK